MEKKEYVAPEVEIVEISEQVSLLAGSGGDGNDLTPGFGDGEPPLTQ